MKRNRRRALVARVRLPEVTLTPLIDTALTLLIIFMVTAPMLNNAIRVQLPKGKAKEYTQTQQELVVSVDQGGKLFFNGKEMADTAALIVQIKQVLAGDRDRTVIVRADETVAYGRVLELVDNIKVVGGVSYVALATKAT